MRESAFAKARRYVTEGRLLVTEVTTRRISALCRGDGKIYALGYTADGWRCDCPAVSRDCAHLRALRLVTVATHRPDNTRAAETPPTERNRNGPYE